MRSQSEGQDRRSDSNCDVLLSADGERHRRGLDDAVQWNAPQYFSVALVNGDEVAARVAVKNDTGRGGQHARISFGAFRHSRLRDLPCDLSSLDVERSEISRRRRNARALGL